jgi:hypothetical protein
MTRSLSILTRQRIPLLFHRHSPILQTSINLRYSSFREGSSGFIAATLHRNGDDSYPAEEETAEEEHPS